MKIEVNKRYINIANNDIAKVINIDKKNKSVTFLLEEAGVENSESNTDILRKFLLEGKKIEVSIEEFSKDFTLLKKYKFKKVSLGECLESMLVSSSFKEDKLEETESKQLFKLTKRLRDASIAHRLLDYKGKCENLHGHTYHFEINVWFDKQQKNGITMDFNSFKDIDNWIQDNWDHGTIVKEDDQDLIDFLWEQDCMFYSMIENSTVENMCIELRKVIDEEGWLKDAVKYTVKIWETETSSCEL